MPPLSKARKLPKPAPSRLQANLGHRILQYLKERDVAPGHHLVEKDLCEHFAVSRTPIHGALALLAERGVVEASANRGYFLRKKIKDIAEEAPLRVDEDEAKQLLIAIAQARNSGTLPDEVPQQEFLRRFNVRMPTVVQVLRQLAELGIAERKEGNGWSFAVSIDSARARTDSYSFRYAIEPTMLLLPTFQLDRAWVERTKKAHMTFGRRKWRTTDPDAFYEVNADFHEHLALCSGNRYMHNAIIRQIQLGRFLSRDSSEQSIQQSISEHMEILAALEAGWNDKAAALMRHHLMVSTSNIVAQDAKTDTRRIARKSSDK